MMMKLNRENLIAWAKDLYSCDGKWEYWHNLSQFNYAPDDDDHDCGCVVGEIWRDFGLGPSDTLDVLKSLGCNIWRLYQVNDNAPDGPERAKAGQAELLRQLRAA